MKNDSLTYLDINILCFETLKVNTYHISNARKLIQIRENLNEITTKFEFFVVKLGGTIHEKMRTKISCHSSFKGTVSQDFIAPDVFPQSAHSGPIRDVLGPF